ncbi:type IV pilus biogenesis/stability protein PilW [Limnobaculum zhutongyuii]|uniref:Type IV pilus biogenesis/stability protein PilW n=1 Tax=Limnobaculum zhutongyuii TaxID=2498113 RepID=A0A411WPJ2_9GAMM|nr:type IV pilus biogenesis/stability protein PilW [Limnobaculum zhutongyuii]QBH98050.1 type IV pilus biogenesis/stability protein PilW [Limnobaculum zhutongyuii]TQS88090.1 type IV pilus biogenesis/stability protein PilW [Limnobaculum zhutongyuii]
MQKILLSIPLLTGILMGCNSQRTEEHAADMGQAAEIRLTLGMAYLSQGDTVAARKNLERAVNYAPQDYRTQLGMGLYLQGIGENEQAASRYHTALQLAPENGDVLNNYGAFLCSLGQYDEAQRYFELAAATERLDDVSNSLEYSGYCLLQAGQPDEADKKLSRALKQNPEKGVRILNTAARYWQQGRREEAQTLLNLYQQELPVSAESLWIQIQFAASDNRVNDIKRYGKQLAQGFSQSKQYQLFLAHEY